VRDSKENREIKMAARTPGDEKLARIAPRISRGHFILAAYLVSLDGPSKKGVLVVWRLKTCCSSLKISSRATSSLEMKEM